MDDRLKQEFLTAVRQLAELPDFSATKVADALGRRLELVAETDVRLEYRLVGGPGFPFGAASFTHGPVLGRSALQLDAGPGVSVTGKEAFDFWGDGKFGLVAPDAEDPRQIHTLARRVPVGELRFLVETATSLITTVWIANFVELALPDSGSAAQERGG